MQEFVRSVKSQPCADCHAKYPHYVMQFDHVRGTKQFMLSKVTSNFVALHRVLAEIAKCDVVCSNCHAARTWLRANSPVAQSVDAPAC